MPSLNTKNLGAISWEPASEIEFPCGLPGFEDRRRFVAVHFGHTDPLIFLQSVDDAALCFITLPIRAVEPDYRLSVREEDLALVGLPTDRTPHIGEDVHCLAVLSIRETGTTANLLAPVIVNLKNLKAVQAVAQEGGYSHQHPLPTEEMAAAC
ncbi:MAG TPA: flagellar assembly protein FliW [Bryobacteraceae bacterium]|nr:flagellar assembly protein FliW [Bryobacteraceae bacterium]